MYVPSCGAISDATALRHFYPFLLHFYLQGSIQSCLFPLCSGLLLWLLYAISPLCGFPLTVIQSIDPVHHLMSMSLQSPSSSIQIQTTPSCATLVTTRFWWSRKNPRVRAEKAAGIPPDALGVRAVIPAALVFPSAPPCCPPPCA